MIFRRSVPGWRLALLGLAVMACPLFAQPTENLPPKPAAYFTDQAGLIDGATAHAINEELAQFERDTSNQILVAIYPKLPPDADLAQYSIDTGNYWQAGQKGKDNGAVLFIFAQDRKMFIATGRGLEGSLPDITCNHIIGQEITPRFRQGDYAGGIQEGVEAMIAATKGEYKGTGQTNAEGENSQGHSAPVWLIVLFVILVLISIWGRASGRSGFGGPMIYMGSGFGRGGFGGGGFGGGGGGGGFGGFSGGGGSFGGGGAGGSW